MDWKKGANYEGNNLRIRSSDIICPILKNYKQFMYDYLSQAQYKKPWVIERVDLTILIETAIKYGLMTEIGARAGDCMVTNVGCGEATIEQGQIGVWVYSIEPFEIEQDLSFFHDVDNAIRTRQGMPEL